MTAPARQPHPQRCDNNCVFWSHCRGDYRPPCATHISPPAPTKKPSCYVTCPFNDLCANDIEKIKAIEAEAAKAEREKVLDDLMQWCNDNWHGAFIVQYEKQQSEQVVDFIRLKAMLKSLRSQEREPE